MKVRNNIIESNPPQKQQILLIHIIKTDRE